MSYDEAVKIIGANTKKGTGTAPAQQPAAQPTTASTARTTQAIDIINTPSADIISELNKLGTFQEKLQWLKDNNLLEPITINGKSYNTVDYSDRVMVLLKIGQYNIPFYISTGQAGKKNVKAGNWYAVFGIGETRGWINKGSEKDINDQYNFPLFQKLAKILNEGVGKIETREDNGNGKLKDGVGFLDFDNNNPQQIKDFNAQMNLPTKPAGSANDSSDFYKHVNSTITLLNQELANMVAATPKEEPVVLPIQNGTMQFSTSTETFAEYYSFEVKDGKIVSGKYRSSFQGEYRDSQEERPIPESELNSTYNKVKNYKDQKIKETTPAPKAQPGEQLGLFDEETTPDNTIVSEELRGKVMYVSPGMNIVEAVNADPFIIAGDDFIAIELAKSGLEVFEDVTPDNLTKKIAEFWSGKNKSQADIDTLTAALNKAYVQMKGLSDEGFTVLTQSMAFLNNKQTPLDLVITPSKGSVYANAQSDVLQIKQRRAAELGARATKTHRVTDATSILDVLTGKEKLKSSKLTLTDENMSEQIENIKNIPAIYDMMYEVDLMTDAQLAELGVTRDEVSDMLENRLQQLSTTPDFDDIAEGDILIANDGTQMYVVWHNKNTGQMAVRPVGTKDKGEVLTYSNYDKKIKAIFAKGMEIKETKPEITPEEQKAAEENIKASIAELDPTALKEMEDQIDTDEDSALDDINLC